MPSPVQTLTTLSIQDYLTQELHSDVRHEFVAGQIFAMGGASRNHNRIVRNLTAALHAHLRGGPCEVFASDMKVSIEAVQSFYYPDVVVTCDPTDREEYFVTRPTLIIEVLSPTTEVLDRREKWLNYRRLASLQEYVLIAQGKPMIEVLRRSGEQTWERQTYTIGDEVEFNSIGLRLAVATLYDSVDVSGAA